MNTRKTPAKTERRKMLEARIYELFEIAEEPSDESYKANGLGKYDIKRILEMDKDFKVSINTVKTIVDNLVEEKSVRCINPDDKTALRFRLVVTPRRSFER